MFSTSRASRRLAPALARRAPIRSFGSTSARSVQVGDAIPNVELMEDSPGNKVNLKDDLAKGKGLIIGVPAAFSKPVLPVPS